VQGRYINKWFMIYDNHIYFTHGNTTNGTELWRTDGTTTTMISIFPWTWSSDPGNIYVFWWELYFVASDWNSRELWKTNGTTTVKVTNINSVWDAFEYPSWNPEGYSNLPIFHTFKNELYFWATDTSWLWLWKTNGIVSEKVSNITPSTNSSIKRIHSFNNELYVDVYDDIAGGNVLWKYIPWTWLIKPLWTQFVSTMAPEFYTGNNMIFWSNEPVDYPSLWKCSY
jgi:ELWxxDGT repeat protein